MVFKKEAVLTREFVWEYECVCRASPSSIQNRHLQNKTSSRTSVSLTFCGYTTGITTAILRCMPWLPFHFKTKRISILSKTTVRERRTCHVGQGVNLDSIYFRKSGRDYDYSRKQSQSRFPFLSNNLTLLLTLHWLSWTFDECRWRDSACFGHLVCLLFVYWSLLMFGQDVLCHGHAGYSGYSMSYETFWMHSCFGREIMLMTMISHSWISMSISCCCLHACQCLCVLSVVVPS